MDIVKDLMDYLITGPLLIVLVLLLLCIFVPLIYSVFRFSGFGGEHLIDHVYDEIKPNDYFSMELEKCSLKFAQKMMKYHHGSDFEPYRRKMWKKLKPLFLCQTYDEKRNRIVVTFSPIFIDFVGSQLETLLVRDFYMVATDYIRYMHKDLPVVVHKSSEFEEHLSEMLLNELRTADNIYNAELETAELQKKMDEDENSPANVKKRIVVAYNATIQEIKSHNNRGLNPIVINILKDSFLVKILSLKVFTQQKLFDMTSDNAMEFNDKGCYVIYNTFTRKYFVGQSDTMFTRVCTIITSPTAKACVELKNDIDLGHMILVKFISLQDSGYTDINRLHRDLILSYDCRQPKGYNK